MERKSVTFFLMQFPVLSQTFVIEQIKGLIDLGHNVNIIALYHGNDSVQDNEIISKYDLIAKTAYLIPQHKRPDGMINNILLFAKNTFFCISKPQVFPLIKAAFQMTFKGLWGEAELFSYLARNCYKQNCHEVIIAHFGHVGVICNLLNKSKVISGKQMTVFHGHELSVYRTLSIWQDFYREMGRSTELLLPISELWASRLQEIGISSDKIRVHHMGVDIQRFFYKERDPHYPLRILSVARATEKKGIKYAINAVLMCGEGVEYNVIGGGKLHNALVEQVNGSSHATNIKLLGAKPPSDVAEALQNTDVFLLPSVTDQAGDMEGIPVSLMEAMATGVIVISTFHSGIPELIEHNVSGLLAQEKNSEELSKLIKLIMNKGVELNIIRNNAREKVKNEFNSEILHQELSRIIKDI